MKLNHLYEGKKYKAVTPEETVQRIRQILHNNDIFVVEAAWFLKHKCFSSLGLGIPGLPISANGKGVNEKYALASAYGEFVERLQNLLVLNQKFHCGNRPFEKITFSDVEPCDYMKFKEENPEMMLSMFDIEDVSELDSLLVDEKMHAHPYVNAFTGEIMHLPYELLLISVGSNGMCAGNTPEEALIQGLCEIFERYAFIRMFTDDTLVFPTIPEVYLKDLPQWEYFEILRENGFEVYAKDFSLGGKIPVAGVLIKKGDKAIFNVGSAPDYSVAIERCITEMFQGFVLETIEHKLQPIAPLDTDKTEKPLSSSSKRITHQYYKSLRAGVGIVNPKIFNNSAPFNPDYLFRSNNLIDGDALKQLLKVMENLGHEVYVRDVSFLGFPSYHVYIPGMSEVVRLDFNEMKLRIKDVKKARQIFFNIDQAGKEDLLHLIRTLENLMDSPFIERGAIMSTVHDLSLSEDTILHDVEPENLLVMLYYKTGDYQSAYNILLDYLKERITPEQMHNPPEFCMDHYCLFKIMEQLANGVELAEAKQNLEHFFEPELLDEIHECLQDTTNLSSLFGIPKCTDCATCEIGEGCNYQSIDQLAQKIKTCIEGYDFTQENVKNVLSQSVIAC